VIPAVELGVEFDGCPEETFGWGIVLLHKILPWDWGLRKSCMMRF